MEKWLSRDPSDRPSIHDTAISDAFVFGDIKQLFDTIHKCLTIKHLFPFEQSITEDDI